MVLLKSANKPNLFITLIITFSASFTMLAVSNCKQAIASPSPHHPITYQKITRDVDSQYAIDTILYPGRITTIDFSQTDEVVTYIGLGDASKVVFNTDSPLDSGTAKSVFLRSIQPLNFPGATTTKITNLVIKTIDNKQTRRIYNFQLVHSQGKPTSLGVMIVPQPNPRPKLTINIGYCRTASLDDVQTGLEFAIARGYTKANDPVVFKVKNFLAIALNQDISLAEAVQAANVEMAVIVELARIAFDNFASPKFIQTTIKPHPNL